MNINKQVIDKLVQSNENISKLFSSLNSLKEEELKYVLDEIARIKNSKKDKSKKKIDSVKIDENIVENISELSKVVSKKPIVTKSKPISILKNVVIPNQKIQENQQSSLDFERKINETDIQDEKLKVLKSISSKLIFKKIEPKKENKKSNGLLSKLGVGLFDLLGGGISAGKKVIKKFGVGKTLGFAYALKSGYDLFKDIKNGYSDYRKFKNLGDNVSAENVLFKTFIGSFGNLFNIIGTFVPGPFKALLYGLGGFMNYTASEFDDIISDKSNVTLQNQQKSKRVMDLINQGEKNNILLLRPRTKNWEYKDYATNEWKTLLDSDGKPISTWTDRVQTVDKTPDGVQRYKLKSNGRLLDLVLVNGKPKLKTDSGYEEITPRQKGGPVYNNKKYLVGENGKELYKTNSDNIFKNTFDSINKSISKMIDKLPTFKEFFTPQYVQFNQIRKSEFDMTGKEIIDFSKISNDSKERFNQFYEQLSKFEGGFANVKGDKGGKTKYGITQTTYSAYLKKNKLQNEDVANISKDMAERIAYEEYYVKSGADKISDAKMSYLVFDTYFMSPSKGMEFKKKYGNDVEKFIQARKEFHLERSTQKDQEKFREGWMNRIKTIENKVKKHVEEARIDSVKNEFKKVSMVDDESKNQSFLINNIVPLMADAVSDMYGI